MNIRVIVCGGGLGIMARKGLVQTLVGQKMQQCPKVWGGSGAAAPLGNNTEKKNRGDWLCGGVAAIRSRKKATYNI